MQRYKRWTVSLSVLLGTVLLAACKPDTPNLTEQEHQTMNAMTKITTPRCIGRYMLDLPDGFVLNSESSAIVDEVKIEVTPTTKTEFTMQLQDLRNKYRQSVLPGKLKAPRLRSVENIPGTDIGDLFDLAESDATSDRMARLLEAIGWRDGYKIRLRVTATDTTFPEDANDSIARQLRTDVSEKRSLIVGVFNRIRGRQDSEVPTEQGFCIPNGFVKGPAAEGEEVLFFYHLKGANDVYFRFETASTYHEDTNLLDRSKQIEASLAEAKGQTVRKGRKETHGISHDEWLATGQTTDNVRGQLFSFEANSKLGTAKAPIMLFTFYNGYRVPAPERTLEQSAVLPDITKATLSEAESVALWDAVIPTLRPRPGAF